MLREMVIGGALLLGGGYYIASMMETAAIVRIVDAPPEEVYKGFSAVLNAGDSRVARFARPGDWGAEAQGRPVPKVKAVPGQEIDYSVDRGGKPMMRIHVRLRPEDGGKKTRLLLDYDVHELERVAEGQGAVGGFAIKAFLSRGMALMTDSIVARIETGGVGSSDDLFDRLNRQMAADPQFASVYRGESARAASRPMVNPDVAKVNPRGTDPRPTVDLSSER